ncbi:MAG TPA: hypothetical protein VKL19_07565 [Thermoanaerobaculia bacterium]|nr:hypothetical protein [Thermoanaerobaculia bacterium]
MTDHQNIATGLTGDPVVFGGASGVTINRNSQGIVKLRRRLAE